MPNTTTVAGAELASKVAAVFNELDSLYAGFDDKLKFLAATFNGLGEDAAAKEALKQAAFVEPRLKKGLKPASVNQAWSRFIGDCEKRGITFNRWQSASADAVKKRDQRDKAKAVKPKAVLEAEAKLAALKEAAKAEAKAASEAKANVRKKLAETLKVMGPGELEKVYHFALKLVAPKK